MNCNGRLARRPRGYRLDQRELDGAFAALRKRDALDFGEPDALTIAQLIELAGLGAQHAAQMLRSFAEKHGGVEFEVLDEKAPAHAGDSSNNSEEDRRNALG